MGSTLYEGNGISRSTFKRMLSKAKKLGIITIYETERKNGSQSSNLYVFNRFPANEPPKGEKLNPHNETSNPLETENKKDINKRYQELARKLADENNVSENQTTSLQLDSTFVDDRIPNSFIKWVKIYFNDAKMIEEFWKMTKIAANKNYHEVDSTQIVDLAITCFKQLVRNMKYTRKVKNPIAYFYAILNQKLKEIYYQELYEMEFASDATPRCTSSKNTHLSLFQQWLETP